jgi:carbonic anhydrase
MNIPKNGELLIPLIPLALWDARSPPLDVRDAKPADLPALKIEYQGVPLNIVDNGHTIQVNYAPGSLLSVGEKIYTHPSEEHVNGRGFPLVAHLVHADSEGRLAVIAVLFETGPANALIDTLWKNIPAEKEKAQDVSSVSVQVGDLLPCERGYFTFKGSLTTPPCTGGVTWYVLQSHATISQEQVDAFAKIYPGNARPIQPTNGREILRSK